MGGLRIRWGAAARGVVAMIVVLLALQAVPDPARAEELAAQLALLAEGAQTTAAIAGDTSPARHARLAAATLIDVATR